jgi:hypothetical protein
MRIALALAPAASPIDAVNAVERKLVELGLTEDGCCLSDSVHFSELAYHGVDPFDPPAARSARRAADIIDARNQHLQAEVERLQEALLSARSTILTASEHEMHGDCIEDLMHEISNWTPEERQAAETWIDDCMRKGLSVGEAPHV